MNKGKNHSQAVKNVQSQVKKFYSSKKQARIFHGGTNSTRSRKFDHTEYIDISHLNKIIEINEKEQYAMVEPSVSMGQIVDATLKHGLIPPVVSEFPSITIGGAVQGGALESSSFKWGCFHDFCLEYEIILGDGRKIIANKRQNTDLFYGIPCSYGSLGIITKVKLQLIPVAERIKVTYQKIDSFEEAIRAISEHSIKTEGPDFVDCTMFSRVEGVLMLGFFTNETGLPEASFHKWHDEWFYIHAKKNIKNKDYYEELIVTRDYMFRYDRGAFWMGEAGARILGSPFNRFMRLVFAPLFRTHTLYRFLHDSGLSQQFLIQDCCVPLKNAIELSEYVDKKYEIYPLALCPLKPSDKWLFSPTKVNDKLVVDVGVWGSLPIGYEEFIRANRELERKLKSTGGRKILYAHNYYTEKEFWEVYDQAAYIKLRKKYAAEIVFPDIYDKTLVKDRYRQTILRAWWKLLYTPIKGRILSRK